ncbi:LamG domain-containing protein [Amycolatopsis sp.]|uniref:LamG domain-containing protein n=1 Tax=Amycolatopsis sp. TaxID=37632 RepID=UPI002D7E7ED4|nr:LamG domain-containing protein [Amycolatopsis sp.]HET6708314.1 LamG domain-containing protein [Amycolatopsis sp.]
MRKRTGAPKPRFLARAGAVLAAALVAGGLASGTSAQAENTNGLMLWYPLNESSGTVAHDASGHGRDGTVNGFAGWLAEEGLTFDGSGTYVKMPDNLMAGLNSITVAFDVWIDPDLGKPYFLYGLGNTNGGSANGYLFATGNQFRSGITLTNLSGEQQTRPGSSYALERGVWKHVAYTQTGNTGILYENGVEKARNTGITITPGAIGGGTTPADYIGRSLYSSDLYFKGRMRDFRLYDRALSAGEVGSVAAKTDLQWEQLQALVGYNGLLGSWHETNHPAGTGPMYVRAPQDYPADKMAPWTWDVPPNWTSEFGVVPDDWPNWNGKIGNVLRSQFTVAQIGEVEDAAVAQIQPDGDTTYAQSVSYDVQRDQVVVRTDAPASVTDPLVSAHPGRITIEAYKVDKRPPARCAPEQMTAGTVVDLDEGPAAGVADAATLQQRQQVKAQVAYNCALASYTGPDGVPVVVFPSDRADISVANPPGWTDEYGQAPADWPVPAAVRSAQFTVAQVTDIEAAAQREITATTDDSPAYRLTVGYDGPSDRVVVTTDAPSSVTDPLVAAYPGKVVIKAFPASAPAADPGFEVAAG